MKVKNDIERFKNKIKLSKSKIELSFLRQDFPGSSNVARLAFDMSDEILYIEFQDGAVYQYLVDRETFNSVLNGEATCVTSGENEYGRWWEGKSPSVGAAVYRHLKQTNVAYREIGVMP